MIIRAIISSKFNYCRFTSDKFNFWLSQDVIVNPFDIVEVEQVAPDNQASKTYGLVTILEHRTDAPNHLANFISSNFGDITEEPNTPRQGTTAAKVNVLSNNANIYMPVPNEKLVIFKGNKSISNVKLFLLSMTEYISLFR